MAGNEVKQRAMKSKSTANTKAASEKSPQQILDMIADLKRQGEDANKMLNGAYLTQVKAGITELEEHIGNIPASYLRNALTDKEVSRRLKRFGLTYGGATAVSEGAATGEASNGRTRLSDEEFVAALPDKSAKDKPIAADVAKKLGKTDAGVGGRLKKLKGLKLVDSEEDKDGNVRWFKL